MVDLLSSALKQLNKENRKQALLISVGKSRASKNFCKGSFPAVLADEWWSHWNVRARDVVVLRRNGERTWEQYCQFSMNGGPDISKIVAPLVRQTKDEALLLTLVSENVSSSKVEEFLEFAVAGNASVKREFLQSQAKNSSTVTRIMLVMLGAGSLIWMVRRILKKRARSHLP